MRPSQGNRESSWSDAYFRDYSRACKTEASYDSPQQRRWWGGTLRSLMALVCRAACISPYLLMEGLARTRDILTALRHEGFLCIHGNILVISMDHVNRECEVLEFIQELWQRLGFPGGSVGKNPLPGQETRVRSLVQEDPPCCGAIKPVHHAYGVCVPEPESRNSGVRMRQVLKPERPGASAPQWEAATTRCLRTATREKPAQTKTQHSQWANKTIKNYGKDRFPMVGSRGC